MLKTGIELNHNASCGVQAELRELKLLGFDCVDVQLFVDTTTELFELSDEDFVKKVSAYKALIESENLEIYQAHGPWRFPPRDTTQEERNERFEVMAKSLRGCKFLGTKRMIIHPIMPYGMEDEDRAEETWTLNLDFYSRLSKIAEREKVIICIENMPMPKFSLARHTDIMKLVKEIASPYFKICLDTGHSDICKVPSGKAVREIGKEYLEALHVHDNDSKGDWHWIPYNGVVDWEDFKSALKEIGFEGCMSLETAVKNADKLPKEIYEHQRKGLGMIADHLADI